MTRVSSSAYSEEPARLMIHVRKGVNLAIRGFISRSRNPYVTIRMGKQKLKTHVVKKNVNPEWNEDLTLSFEDPSLPSLPIKIIVYDKHKFIPDKKMGEAEFEIGSVLEASQMPLEKLERRTSGDIIRTVIPNSQNCLAKESHITWTEGKVVQEMVLGLQNVKCGEVELQLQWIDIPRSWVNK